MDALMLDPDYIKDKAHERYQLAKKNFEKSQDDLGILRSAAQEVNDAWLEYKKADTAASNHSTLKKIGDLYGC